MTTDLIDTLVRLEVVLRQTAPTISSRLHPGLTAVEIEGKVASFLWAMPDDVRILYQWHDGLSGTSKTLNLAERFLRLKGKWHGELVGQENEIHLLFENRLVITKFLPLAYALAGHQHLKLGRCPLNLLPIAILIDGNTTIYCMVRLGEESPMVYFANGTNLPPMRVTESFLSTQPQCTKLSDLVTFLIDCFEHAVDLPMTSQEDQKAKKIDCEIDSDRLSHLFQQFVI